MDNDRTAPDVARNRGPHPSLPYPALASYQLCGVKISPLTLDRAVRLILESASSRTGLQMHLCNAYTLSLLGSDTRLMRALQAADCNIADGWPVARLAPQDRRRAALRGPDVMRATIRDGVPQGARHYLLGGSDGVAAELASSLEFANPLVNIVGKEEPGFGPLDEEELDEIAGRVRRTDAQVVWIGLGTPKQDYAVHELAQRLPNVILVPVGAAFDFLSGRVREAPKLLRGSGFEWVYRLSVEPRRLWKRYLVGNLRFISLALRSGRRS